MPETDPVAALADLDPKRVGEQELAELLEKVTDAASGDAATPGSLGVLGAQDFSRLIKRASTAQLDAVVQRPALRELVLDEVFRRMSEHYKADRTEAVVRWRIGALKGGEDDRTARYECVLSGGTCQVRKETQDEPRVTIMIPPVEFLKLASGNASAPTLFMTGKLKVAGDVGFAAGLTKLFQIPQA